MPLEIPTLRIGSAGFTGEQQERLRLMLPQASSSGLRWEFGQFNDADVLWFNGARCQMLIDGTLRAASGLPGGRSVHVRLEDVDRPVAFAQPAPRQVASFPAFDIGSLWSVGRVLELMEGRLRPVVAKFCLASQILEQETALGSGLYHVATAGGRLLAVVNLRGDVGVLPTASPPDFENATWTPVPKNAGTIPEHFVRTTLSQLMWLYALRTTRDVLPPRYRTDLLYFRRPPRLPQRLLRDSHLLLVRELAIEPGTHADLQQRTGLGEPQISQDLAALYLVGAITSNPRRAAPLSSRWAEAADTPRSPSVISLAPSGLEQESSPQPIRSRMADLTAPAPLVYE